MAGFIPFISEILPMIMPASTHVTSAKDLEPEHPTVEGPVVQREAIVGHCDKMCASDRILLHKYATTASKVRHVIPQPSVLQPIMGLQDTIIYAVSGTATLIVKEGFEDSLRKNNMAAGAFAFIPAWTEHQVKNDTDEDAVWVIIQSGSRPVGAVLTDWGGEEVQHEE